MIGIFCPKNTYVPCWISVIMLLACLPAASASTILDPFPDVTFATFNGFVQQQFSSQVSLATVMTVLFTMTNNSDLLNLHAHQQHPRCQGETCQLNTGWIKALAKALQTQLGEATDSLLCNFEQKLTDDEVTNSIGIKLDSLSKVLKLHPYNQCGVFLGKLNPISEQSIEPVHVICPAAMECETRTCNSYAILKKTSIRDTPTVTLIKGKRLYNDVSALSGHCPQCKTGYYADHERVQKDGGQ